MMNTTLILEIERQVLHYLQHLDWAYILTFIMIGYVVNSAWFTRQVKQKTGICLKRRYRMAVVGLLYAVILFFLRGYELPHIESLFQSFVFALVFHKLLIDGLISYLSAKFKQGPTSQENEA